MTTSYNHPLVRPIELGQLVSHEVYRSAETGWRTIFYYERGAVELHATNNGQSYHYTTLVENRRSMVG